jgi:hypothetical protein
VASDVGAREQASMGSGGGLRRLTIAVIDARRHRHQTKALYPQPRHRALTEAAGRAFAPARGQGAATRQLMNPYFSHSASRLSICAIALGRCTVTT